jgi:hypothetical protein
MRGIMNRGDGHAKITSGSIEDLFIARLQRRHKPLAAARNPPNLAGIERKEKERKFAAPLSLQRQGSTKATR